MSGNRGEMGGGSEEGQISTKTSYHLPNAEKMGVLCFKMII